MEYQSNSKGEDLRTVLLTYLEACEEANSPPLEEWIKKYPQYQDSLTAFAVYNHVVEDQAQVEEENACIANIDLDIERSALHEAFSEASAPDPLQSLVNRARHLKIDLVSLANSLDLGVDLLLKLERRVLLPETVPNQLVDQLAQALYCRNVDVRSFLSGPTPQPARTFYHAKVPPRTGESQTFAEAVRQSRMMREEQKALWLHQIADTEA